MGQLLHCSAKTTHVSDAVRAELQRSKAPAAVLVRRYGINERTVRKWRSRLSVEDEQMGPKEHRRAVLSAPGESGLALKDVTPHRCPQRHGISRLRKADQEKPKGFKAY